jgi:hypothetical protein
MKSWMAPLYLTEVTGAPALPAAVRKLRPCRAGGVLADQDKSQRKALELRKRGVGRRGVDMRARAALGMY